MTTAAQPVPHPVSPPVSSGESAKLTGLLWLARIGYGAKAIVLLTLGLLAANAVIRLGDTSAELPVDQRVAVRAIHHAPMGSILVGSLSAGLLCYAVWQGLRGLLDPERRGRHWTALLRRAWYLWLGLLNLALAASAGAVAVGLARQGRYFRHPDDRWTLTDAAVTVLSTPTAHRLLWGLGAIAFLYGLERSGEVVWRILRKGGNHDRSGRWRRRAQRLNLAGRGAAGFAVALALGLAGYFNSARDLYRVYQLYQRCIHAQYSRPSLVLAATVLIIWGGYDLLRMLRPSPRTQQATAQHAK